MGRPGGSSFAHRVEGPGAFRVYCSAFIVSESYIGYVLFYNQVAANQ